MKTAIGFLNGDICIRDGSGDFIIQDKEKYLPIIKEKINERINSINSSEDLRISNIIISSLKESFGINSVFISKISNSSIPHSDTLYISLERYVKENETYIKKFNEINHCRKLKRETIKNKKKENLEHNSYCCELKKRKEHFKKMNGYKKI